jgi:hypothetical protein
MRWDLTSGLRFQGGRVDRTESEKGPGSLASESD